MVEPEVYSLSLSDVLLFELSVMSGVFAELSVVLSSVSVGSASSWRTTFDTLTVAFSLLSVRLSVSFTLPLFLTVGSFKVKSPALSTVVPFFTAARAISTIFSSVTV